MKIGCIMMAAGNARRFKENKLNAQIDGVSLIDRAFNAVPENCFYKVCVVTQYDEILKKAQKRGFMSVKNEHPDYGISHTIKLGIKALSNCDALMFMVCDQPFLKRTSVKTLIDCYKAKPDYITALSHNKKRGNPCIFPKEFFSELIKLSEDNGGAFVIRQHKDRLVTVEVPKIELSDIDNKDELEKLSGLNTEQT